MIPTRSLKTIAAALAAISLAGAANAATVLVTEIASPGDNFGDTGGVAIDFDSTSTGITANWTPDLVAGQQYNIDNITLYRSSTEASTGTVRLGVYTTLTINPMDPNDTILGGFVGVSSNTIDLSTLAASQAFTFNFTGITVTPETNLGSGGDIRYFVFQTGTTAITGLNVVNDGAVRVPIRRIDAADGQFADELGGILQIESGTGRGLVTTRAPEYGATITAVPEPSAFALLGLASAAVAIRRRRK